MSNGDPQALVPAKELQALLAKVQDCTATVYAENTKRAYLSDWKHFETWCSGHGLCPLPCDPQTAGAYFADKADSLKHSSLKRRLSAIVAAHRQAGHKLDTKHPAIANVLAGIRRKYNQTVTRKKPLLTIDLLAWCAGLGDSIKDIRDKALLLLGFAGALRRSELVSLDLCQEQKLYRLD